MCPPVWHFWELRQKREAKCSTHGGERQENHQAFPQHARQVGVVDDPRTLLRYEPLDAAFIDLDEVSA